MVNFQFNDPSIESQCRALILFSRNTATHKFALGQALLKAARADSTELSLEDLSIPYARTLIDHIKVSPFQTSNKKDGAFIRACNAYINQELRKVSFRERQSNRGFDMS